MKNNSARNSVKGLKYIPVCAFLLMFSHIILLNIGIDFPVSEIAVIMLGYYLAWTFSKAFGFCMLHRLLIYYALTAMICIWLRRFPEGEFGLFGEYIKEARFLMLIIGCVLMFLLALKKLVTAKRKEAE